MLTELVIRNFAIIDRLQLSFGPGFNVLTGETGAGKSIIIDAVGLLLGDRARPDLIRTGEEEAVVEALIDLSARPDLAQELTAAGLADEEDGELLIRRIVSRAGKNRIYINGSLATLGQLQPITANLLAIYGQHEHQSLQRAELHLDLLDRFAGLQEQSDSCRMLHAEVLVLADRLKDLERAEKDRQYRLDLLSHQSREIAAADPRPGEDQELAEERLILQNAGRLAAAAEGGFQTLYAEEGAVCERLGRIAAEFESLAEIDAHFTSFAETARTALYSLEDIAMQLREYGGRLSFDPDRQGEVEERLALLAALKRKYAPTVEEILRRREEIDRQIEELGDLETAREGLGKRLHDARGALQQIAETLSFARRIAARRLAEAVQGELKDLAMPNARFEVRLVALEAPGQKGLEKVEFLLSANPGEEPRPLARIASGGELSRIMLAIKRVAPEGDNIPTLIFDEVDAGVGGVAATAVGEKLHRVSKGIQVLCITHLPQVAAFADQHFRVEKKEEGGRTFTTVAPLREEQRVAEMARMLGGAKVTDRTMAHAREMIALVKG
jgi:DNA repair protein RecN (Recombination protein N)